ncbi:MAG: hypothetical protein AVDCRST_MAG54-2394, partial [uncultured Actinomycetospora sp.]
ERPHGRADDRADEPGPPRHGPAAPQVLREEGLRPVGGHRLGRPAGRGRDLGARAPGLALRHRALGAPHARAAGGAGQARGLQRRERRAVVRSAAHAAPAQGLLRRGPDLAARPVRAHRGRRRVPPLADVRAHGGHRRRRPLRPARVGPPARQALLGGQPGSGRLRRDPRGRGGARPAAARAGERRPRPAPDAPGQPHPHHGGGAPRLLRPRRGHPRDGDDLAHREGLPALHHRVHLDVRGAQPDQPEGLRVGRHRPRRGPPRRAGQPAPPRDDPVGRREDRPVPRRGGSGRAPGHDVVAEVVPAGRAL